MEKRMLFRLLMVPLLLLALWTFGFPIEVLAVLGAFFVLIILLRGKIWKAVENEAEKFLPFVKEWPDWAQKAVLIILFILSYLVLKQVLYFALGFVGIDIGEMILSSLDEKTP